MNAPQCYVIRAFPVLLTAGGITTCMANQLVAFPAAHAPMNHVPHMELLLKRLHCWTILVITYMKPPKRHTHPNFVTILFDAHTAVGCIRVYIRLSVNVPFISLLKWYSVLTYSYS